MEKEQLLKELKQEMLQEIKNAVNNIKLDVNDEVCYISLMGTDPEPVLGLITLGVKSYRDEMVQEEDSDLWYLWNSAEMPGRYQTVLTKTFEDKQQKFVELTADDDWKETWEICQTVRFEVAYQLNCINWNDIFPVTQDFVVYSEWEAIDVEGGDLVRSIPVEKLQVLRGKGLA